VVMVVIGVGLACGGKAGGILGKDGGLVEKDNEVGGRDDGLADGNKVVLDGNEYVLGERVDVLGKNDEVLARKEAAGLEYDGSDANAAVTDMYAAAAVAGKKASKAKRPKCKKPTGTLDMFKNLGCASAVCRRSGGGAAWEKCPQPATKIEINSLEEEFKSSGKKVATKLESLETNINNTAIELANINTKVENTGKQLAAVTTKVENTEKQLADVNTKVENTGKQLADVNTKVDNVITKVENTGKQLANVNTKVDNTATKVDNVKGEVDKILTILNGMIGSLPLVFHKYEKFEISKENQIGILQRLGLQFVITFDLSFNTVPANGGNNILHFTTGDNYGAYGDRIPFLYYAKKQFLLSSAISGNGNNYKWIPYSPKANTWYHMEISQLLKDNGEVVFEFKIDGTSYWSITNTDPREFTDVKMFAADPWHYALDGSMRGLTVKTSAA